MSYGPSFIGIIGVSLAIAFLAVALLLPVLKLCGVLTLSWTLALSPLGVCMAVVLLFALGLLIEGR